MAEIVKFYGRDGETKGIWTKQSSPSFRKAGEIPRRASRVEVIADGQRRGLFHVDFTLLSEITGDPRHAVCLVTTFAEYHDAINAEVAWLQANWVAVR